jgi:hypothetical protein
LQNRGEKHDTPFKMFCPCPLIGLNTRDHLLPFHDSMKVLWKLEPISPTTLHELVETQETLLRTLSSFSSLSLGTTDQAVPFHDSINPATNL